MRKAIRGIAGVVVALATLLVSVGSFAAIIQVTINPPSLSEEGPVDVSVSVNNDSTFPMEHISISGHGLTFAIDKPTLEPGESHTYQQRMVVSRDMIGETLTFTVTWTENGETKSSEATAVITMSDIALITVKRTASKTNAKPGETITLNYTIRNLGTVGASEISLKDKAITRQPLIEGLRLEPGQTHEIEYVYTMGNATVISEPVLKYMLDGSETESTYTGDQLTLGMVNAAIDVVVEQGISTPDGVTFTLTLTNDGNQKIKNINVKDQDGNKLNEESFTLAIGEQKVLTYKIVPQETVNVYFRITGTTANGSEYSDRTKTYTVREYVDPALVKVEFTADVKSPVNSEGSMDILFKLNNNGTMVFSNIVLSEELMGEIYKTPQLDPGVMEIPVTVFVEEERMLNFTLNFDDKAGNTYTYTASLSAQKPFERLEPTPTPDGGIGEIGKTINTTLTNTLSTIFTVLVVLTCISAVVLICLVMMEKKNRKKARNRHSNPTNRQKRMPLD